MKATHTVGPFGYYSEKMKGYDAIQEDDDLREFDHMVNVRA